MLYLLPTGGSDQSAVLLEAGLVVKGTFELGAQIEISSMVAASCTKLERR